MFFLPLDVKLPYAMLADQIARGLSSPFSVFVRYDKLSGRRPGIESSFGLV